jgi:hypothetical protein
MAAASGDGFAPQAFPGIASARLKMEISPMGKVIVPATIENLDDVFEAEKGSPRASTSLLSQPQIVSLDLPQAALAAG